MLVPETKNFQKATLKVDSPLSKCTEVWTLNVYHNVTRGYYHFRLPFIIFLFLSYHIFKVKVHIKSLYIFIQFSFTSILGILKELSYFHR